MEVQIVNGKAEDFVSDGIGKIDFLSSDLSSASEHEHATVKIHEGYDLRVSDVLKARMSKQLATFTTCYYFLLLFHFFFTRIH